jgi:hypothetical protein
VVCWTRKSTTTAFALALDSVSFFLDLISELNQLFRAGATSPFRNHFISSITPAGR